MMKKLASCLKSLKLGKNFSIVLFALTFASLSGCSMFLTQTKDDALKTWQVKGRIAVKNSQGGFSANLFWQKGKEGQHFKLFGPLGKTYFEWQERDGVHHLYVHERGSMQGYDADALIAEVLGVELPLSYLEYWAQGLSRPQSTEKTKLDSQGRLTTLEFEQWKIEYLNYQFYNGRFLPSKIRIESNNDVIKLALRDWEV